MSNQVQYIAVLQSDQFLGGLSKISASGTTTWNKLDTLNNKFQVNAAKSAASLNAVDTKLKQTGNTASWLNGELSKIAAGIGIAFVASKIAQFASDVVLATGEVQKYKLTLETMLGSKAAADARMTEYQDIAAKTPFKLQEVVDLGNGLQALGRYSRDNVTMLGDLASAAGKPLDQVRMAYSKLATGQKGEAVNLFRDLLISTDDWVKATGKGVTKNGELMATTAEMLAALPLIMESKNFEGMMDKQAEGVLGKLSNMQDAFYNFKGELGKLFTPLIDSTIRWRTKFIESLTMAIGWLEKNRDLIQSIGVFIGIATAGLLIYQVAVNGVAIVTKIWTAVQWALNAALNANPVGAIIMAIALLVSAIVYLWKHFDWFRGALVAVWEAFKAVFMNLKNLAASVLGGIGDLLIGVFTFDKERIAKGLESLKTGFQEYGQKVGESFSKGYDKGVQIGKSNDPSDYDVPGPPPMDGSGGDGTGDGAGKGTGAGQDIGAFSGSENRKNININIGSLIQKMEFHATNVNSGLDEIADQVKRVLLGAVNNANMISG